MAKSIVSLKGATKPINERERTLSRVYEFLLSLPDCPNQKDNSAIPAPGKNATMILTVDGATLEADGDSCFAEGSNLIEGANQADQGLVL